MGDQIIITDDTPDTKPDVVVVQPVKVVKDDDVKVEKTTTETVKVTKTETH